MLRSISALLFILAGASASVGCTLTTTTASSDAGGAAPAAPAADAGGDAGSSSDGAPTVDAGQGPSRSPVEWADQWLDGWTGSAQGPNSYAHESGGVPLFVQWGDDVGADGQYKNLSDCSYFGSKTLARSYGWTDAGLQSWLCNGTCPVGRPQAVHYHDAIVAQSHFTRVDDVRAVARGDVIAMAYYDGSKDTGHFMLVESAPAALCSTCTPLEYAVAVVDSADGYHGTADTRYIAQACTADADCAAYSQATCDTSTGKCSTTGIGRGTLRLYADASYRVSGYSWSTAASSTAYFDTDSPLLRDVVVGRYDGSVGN